jgi:hypothetical protein
MVANAASLMGMQWGSPDDELGSVEESGRIDISHLAEMDFFRQVMTSWGALSSAWEGV